MSDWIDIYAVDISISVAASREEQGIVDGMVSRFVVQLREAFPRNDISWSAGGGSLPSSEFPGHDEEEEEEDDEEE